MRVAFEFKHARSGVESGFAALILFERMQFADVKAPVRTQNFARLPEDEIYIFDVFERETARYQIKLVFGKFPFAA